MNGIVPGFDQVFIGSGIQNIKNFFHHFRRVTGNFNLFTPFREAGHIQHIDNENGMMRSHRPTRLGDNIRVRQVFRLAYFQQVVDHIVGIFLHRIIGAGSKGGPRPVIVYTQTTAHIYVLDVASKLHQFGIEPPNLFQAVFDPADVGDLASQMKVDQFDTIEDVFIFGDFQGFHQLHCIESKLGVFPGR